MILIGVDLNCIQRLGHREVVAGACEGQRRVGVGHIAHHNIGDDGRGRLSDLEPYNRNAICGIQFSLALAVKVERLGTNFVLTRQRDVQELLWRFLKVGHQPELVFTRVEGVYFVSRARLHVTSLVERSEAGGGAVCTTQGKLDHFGFYVGLFFVNAIRRRVIWHVALPHRTEVVLALHNLVGPI